MAVISKHDCAPSEVNKLGDAEGIFSGYPVGPRT
jgi:hypothetical protein